MFLGAVVEVVAQSFLQLFFSQHEDRPAAVLKEETFPVFHIETVVPNRDVSLSGYEATSFCKCHLKVFV